MAMGASRVWCRKMRADKQDGFTLIEVLASLLIFSIAIIGLTHAGTQSTRSAAAIEMKSLAGVVADNQLIAARALDLETGTQWGEARQMGVDFDYSLITEQTDQDKLYRINATVRRKGQAQVLTTRTAFRVEP